jgi:hypothetical protein
MKNLWIALNVVLAVTGIALSAYPGAAQGPEPLWDFCFKAGDYYDSVGKGYHVI